MDEKDESKPAAPTDAAGVLPEEENASELGRMRVVDLLERVKRGEISPVDAERMVRSVVMTSVGAMLSIAAGPGVPSPTMGEPPPWMPLPPGFRVPRDLPVFYLRLPSRWTRYPGKGIPLPGSDGLWRACVLWELTDSEETQAYKRAMGDPTRANGELARQMIRTIDGHPSDWGASRGEVSSVDAFWTDIGARGRGIIGRIYTQLHSLGPAEQVLFFESCVEARFGA